MLSTFVVGVSASVVYALDSSCSYEINGQKCSVTCTGNAIAHCEIGEGGYLNCYCSDRIAFQNILRKIVNNQDISASEFAVLHRKALSEGERESLAAMHLEIETFWTQLFGKQTQSLREASSRLVGVILAVRAGDHLQTNKALDELRNIIEQLPSEQRTLIFKRTGRTLQRLEHSQAILSRFTRATHGNTITASDVLTNSNFTSGNSVAETVARLNGAALLKDQTFSASGVTVQSTPNPFTERARFRYTLPTRGFARLTLYNALGTPVRTLLEEVADAGEYTVEWNGADAQGNPLPSGIYVYRLETAEGAVSGRISLVR